VARALKQPKNTGRKTGQLRTIRKPGLTKLAKQADIVVEVGLTRRGVIVGFLESLLQTCHSALQFCRLHALATGRQDSFFPDGSEELVLRVIFSGELDSAGIVDFESRSSGD
jgi:hypothetical protein